MFSERVRLDGFTAADWTRLVSLRAGEPAARTDRASDGLFVLRHEGRTLRWHTRDGWLPAEQLPEPPRPSILARRHGVRFCVTAETGALRDASERFGARLRRGSGLFEQLDLLRTIARELAREGRVEVWPRSFELLLRLPAPPLARAAKRVFREGQTAFFALWSAEGLDTSLAVRCDPSGIARISGPVALRRRLPGSRGSPQELVEALDRAARDEFGPLGFAIYAETSAASRLLTTLSPAVLAAEIARGRVLFSPRPSALARALAGARELAARARGLLSAPWAPSARLAAEWSPDTAPLAGVSSLDDRARV